LVLVALSAFITARACNYDFNALARYFSYLTVYVALPGVVTLYAVKRSPLSLSVALALGLPTGFAVEIFSFLGLSALGMKALYPWMPLVWAVAALAVRWRQGEWPLRTRLSAHHAGVGAGLALAFLATGLMAASQMFSESPLAAGLPTRAIFHDWVYLVSRAAVIKNNWPLDDPSLSGTPLQYHYFMMVHAAAASWTTGVEITSVMLRLIFVPLGIVLVMQTYLLGRIVSRTPWGGVVAALLTVVASEVSFHPSYGEPMFLGLFVRWLFVSPTFFFGLIFCGALLLAVGQCARGARCDARHYTWLLMLGAAATGAKGTVVPVLLCALGLWALGRWHRERRFPWRLVLIAGCLTLAFAAVYIPTMLAWRTGDAAFRPFHVFQLTSFWKEYFPAWMHWADHFMPHRLAVWFASAACALVIFAGTGGVRLLAIPYLFWGDIEKRDRLFVGWIGAFFIASAGMGLLLELNSYGELYVILMMRVPMAVLTAAFFVATARRVIRWWDASREVPATMSRSPFARPGTLAVAPSGPVWPSRLIIGTGAAILILALGIQMSLWGARNKAGFTEWLKTPTNLKPDDYMRDLQEALLWVRANTERNAVIVANSCTPENMKKDHWGALDRTLTGVHFYYSALSERRMWFEGPNYILDTSRARLRASLASGFFYRQRPLAPEQVSNGPCYALIDHSLADGATVPAGQGRRVYGNSRIEIFRLVPVPATAPTMVAGGANEQ
jgi:hypothetical protein